MKQLSLLLLLTLLLATGIVFSAPNGLDISWWTVDGGAAVPELNGGSYALQGTTGQSDAGMLSNGRFTLNGGYWNTSISDPAYTVYLPIVLKP